MGHLRCRLQRPAQQARSFWCRLVFRTDPSQIRNEKHLRAYSYNYLNEERSNYYGDNGDDHMGCHGEQPGPAPKGSAGRSKTQRGVPGGAWDLPAHEAPAALGFISKIDIDLLVKN